MLLFVCMNKYWNVVRQVASTGGHTCAQRRADHLILLKELECLHQLFCGASWGTGQAVSGVHHH